jgi:hypothetical protein
MGLRSAFDAVLVAPEPLAQLDELIWQSMGAGARSSRHPWNEGVLSTVDVDAGGLPAPRVRTVILRGVDRQSCTIDCHTDARSAKVRQLDYWERKPQASWLFYSSSIKIQLRLEGTAELINDETADEAWNQTSLLSRSAYVSIEPPGLPHDGEQPPSTGDRIVTQLESERGRANFRILRTTIRRADLLYLRRSGHVRAQLDYARPDRVSATWVVP